MDYNQLEGQRAAETELKSTGNILPMGLEREEAGLREDGWTPRAHPMVLGGQ